MRAEQDETVQTSEFHLAQETIAAYDSDGHVVIRRLVPAGEVEAIRPVVEELVAESVVDVPALDQRDTYGKAFLQVADLNRRSEAVRQFVCTPKLGKVAADLMGVSAVRLYFDQALFKEPGGGFTPWHNDHTYWPIDTDNMITLWLPLDDISAEVGTLEFVSGSHRTEHRELIVISDRSEELYAELVERQNLHVETHGALRAGDATFHSGWTLHRAPGNPGRTTREVLAIVYFEDGVRLIDRVPASQQADFNHYFGGLRPGDIGASEWTPLVYSADSPMT